MPIPTSVSFHNMERSPALEHRILEKVQKLDERYSNRITSCRVSVQAPHHHRARGNLFDVRIDLHLPGVELVVNREGSAPNPAHSDVYVAMRDAFDAALRQVEAHVDRKSERH
jgi:ribosome-associated translation inhibitor RaiA